MGCGLLSAQLTCSPFTHLTDQVQGLPPKATFYDIAFDTKEPNHGWIVGSRGTFLETKDGGETWEA
eukprot:44346-Eustigmatos_ZCMA.PRE.1